MNGVIINMADVRQGERLPIGSRVSYGDMANPRQQAVVISEEIGQYSTGQKCIFVDSYRQTDVSKAAVDGLGGWHMEKGTASTDEIEELKATAAVKMEVMAQERKESAEKAKTEEAKGKEIVEANRPAWAKAALIAEREIDKCDMMSDYFATSTERIIVLAWSKHERDLFPEMRKAALNCDVPEVKALADAPEDAEHREKYSMGAGYYLKKQGRYSTGWLVRKQPLNWNVSSLYRAAAKDGGFQVPAKKAAPVKAEPTNGNGVTLGEYKGHPTITLPNGRKGFSFGLAKARTILEHIDAIRDFADNS